MSDSSPPTTSFPKERIKVLLLENVHASATELFAGERFQIEAMPGALKPDDLARKIHDVHILGIRSKTQVTSEVLSHAKRMLTLGCFCIGTNQVALDAANAHGIPVFNAPFSNTRSVAEMVIAEIIVLARQLGDRSREVHQGIWRKISTGCYEIRGKTLGIIGYGHIGRQVGVLAESLGMRVLFYDIVNKLPMGNNHPMTALDGVLSESHFVTLHVPSTPQTECMISTAQLQAMPQGSYLINASRGKVVDISALAVALKTGHLAGAALDVFPEEPVSNDERFHSALLELPNTILTPHIGGSTVEAQAAIGREVASGLIKFVNRGTTAGAVNFPQVEMPQEKGTHRILNVHKNVPGVLRDINRIVSDHNANIHAQTLATDPNIGYLIMDLDQDVSRDVKNAVASLKTDIKTRILY